LDVEEYRNAEVDKFIYNFCLREGEKDKLVVEGDVSSKLS